MIGKPYSTVYRRGSTQPWTVSPPARRHNPIARLSLDLGADAGRLRDSKVMHFIVE